MISTKNKIQEGRPTMITDKNLDLFNYAAEKPFSQKHLLGLQDYSADEIYQVIA